MFNRLIAWSLHNRWIVLVLALILCALGGYALKRMSVDVFPEFAPPQVIVQTEAPGMSPQDVESLITYPLETAINGTPGVEVVRSKTSVGLSTITVVFAPRTNVYVDRQLISERIQNAKARLPIGSKAPTMMPVTSAVGWLIKYALTSDTASPEALRTISDWEIRPRILALGDIASVVSLGGEIKQYQVLLNPVRMLAYQITPEEIRLALEKSNINVPGAFLHQGGQEFIVGAIGRISTLKDLKSTVIVTRQGVPITIGNVAMVQLGGEIKRGDGAYGLKEAVIGTISKAYGADTVTTTYRVEKALNEIKAQLPANIQLHTQVFRQANFIESAINNLKKALIEGAIIVVIILFIFLMNWRASLITFLSMPISFLIGMLILYAMGVGINAMTLGGLAIAIGEVVDNGIITVENIMRRLRLNRLADQPLPTLEIVFDATQEILNSVVYATIIICLVFVPIFFLEGIAGRIFTPLALAYIASVFASLVVAVTLVPALSYMLLVRSQEKRGDSEVRLHALSARDLITTTHSNESSDEKATERETFFVVQLKKYFLKILPWGIRHWWWVIGSAMAALIIALALLPFFGRSFLPEFHEGNFVIAMTTLPGTSLNESMRLGKIVRQKLLKYPQVVSITQRAGRAELDDDAQPPNFSEFDVRLDYSKGDQLAANKLLKKIRGDLEIPGVAFNVGQFIAHRMDEVLSGARAQVAIKIFGDNLDTLNELGLSVAQLLKSVPGIVDINPEQQVRVPQITIQVDRERAARYGVQVADITQDISMYLNGEVVSTILEGRRSFDLFMRLTPRHRANIKDIQDMLIDATGFTNQQRTKIPLRSIAKIEISDQPYTVNRENVQRLSFVTFNVQGRDLGSVIHDVQARIQKQIKLPTGYYIQYGGQFQSEQQARTTLLTFGGFILLIAFILLYKAFSSAREALLVLFNLPLALIGGIVALFIAGADMSVAAMIGFITLFGIAARNGIILVSHYHQLRRENLPLQTVVIQGTVDRLIPVLMTAATAALGLIPLLWGSPAGKELERPLAQVVLGGLATSTLLNMIVIPTIYYHLEKWRESRTQRD